MIHAPILLLSVVALLASALLLAMPRAGRGQRAEDWARLAAKLQPVEGQGIARIAEGYLHPRKHQLELEPREMYSMVGGVDGLNRMYDNSRVMLALAGHTAGWNFEEGVIVTERIRRDALRLQRSILLIQMEMLLSALSLPLRRSRAAFRLEEAAATYHRMTVRLLALYETSHAGLYPVLAKAL